MQNNFDILKDFYTRHPDRDDEDKFLFGQIMARKKDGSPFCNSNNLIVKDLVIINPEDFDKKQAEIIAICNAVGGRAYLNPNPRSFKRVAIEMAGVCLDYIRTGGEVASRSAFATACGRLKTKNSYWVIDLDNLENEPAITAMIPEVALRVPTVSGAHLLTRGFDLRELRKRFPEIDIHKNNPTLLYYGGI